MWTHVVRATTPVAGPSCQLSFSHGGSTRAEPLPLPPNCRECRRPLQPTSQAPVSLGYKHRVARTDDRAQSLRRRTLTPTKPTCELGGVRRGEIYDLTAVRTVDGAYDLPQTQGKAFVAALLEIGRHYLPNFSSSTTHRHSSASHRDQLHPRANPR